MKKHNHRWLRDSKNADGNAVNFCSTCNCIRTAAYAGKLKYYTYMRSGILFKNRPDCIDWDIENAKTID